MRKQFTQDIKNLVIKVGTSVLTQGGRFDKLVVQGLADEVSSFLKKGAHVSIVSSGAIGAGMSILGLKTRPDAMEELQAAAAVGQRYLMQCYEEAFAKHGFSTAQVLLTWDDLAEKKRFMNARHTLKQIQKWGLVPIINENDTVATDEIRFGDNDKLSSLLSILVEADVLVILSDTNGLYTAPSHGRAAERIQIVETLDEKVFAHINDKKTAFTVGGMRSKLAAIQGSVESGIPVFLANGREEGVLKKIFQAEDVGTFFVPDARKIQRKSWIRDFVGQIESRKPVYRP